MADLNALKTRLDQMMIKVEQLEPGGDLAGLIDAELAGFNRELAEAIVQQRETTTTREGSDPPPCGM